MQARAQLEQDVEADVLAVLVAEDGVSTRLPVEGPSILLVEGVEADKIENLEGDGIDDQSNLV